MKNGKFPRSSRPSNEAFIFYFKFESFLMTILRGGNYWIKIISIRDSKLKLKLLSVLSQP